MPEPRRQDPLIVNANYEGFVFALAALSVLNHLAILLLPVAADNQEVIRSIDFGVSGFLLLDFLVRLMRAPSKRSFFLTFYGWLALLGSLPVPLLRLARLLHAVLLARKLKRSDYITMGRVVIGQRSRSTLLAIVLTAIIVFQVASMLILTTERGAPDANIKTATDALWWGIVTAATVGYGDLYPVTPGGRVVAVLVMCVGIGLFSALTSYLSEWFMRPRGRINRRPIDSRSTTDEVLRELAEIRRMLEQQEQVQQQSHAALSARMAEIERVLKGASRSDEH